MSHDAGIGSEIGSTDGDATTPVVNQENQNQPEPNAMESVAMNPKWDALLSKVPAQLHPMMAPTLHEWDKNYQEMATKYSPYKDFVDNGVDAETIQQALGLMQYSSENPKAIFDALVQNFPQFVEELRQAQTPNDNSGQQQQPEDQMDLGNPFDGIDIENHPKFREMKNNVDTVAGFLAQQLQAQTEDIANEQIDTELEELRGKYGEFDEQFVFGLAVNGIPLETAVQRFKQMEQNIRSQPVPGSNHPRVMTPGGGMPSSALDVTKLDDKDVRGLALRFLQNSRQQENN